MNMSAHLRLCRLCGEPLNATFVDLGMSPLSNHYLKPSEAEKSCRIYPLHACVCGSCFLVQLAEYEPPEQIFGEYAYFSSYSDSWLKHARDYARRISRKIPEAPHIVEVACNDGYLLQYFRQAGMKTLGIEPARNVAEAAKAKGIPVLEEFFGADLARKLAREHGKADLMIANNVLAHVPDLHDFVSGFKLLLKERGIVTLEFPHLQQLIRHNQFDTVYHEHFSYFSLHAAQRLFAMHGMTVFDVEQLDTHGASMSSMPKMIRSRSARASADCCARSKRRACSGLKRTRRSPAE
jgi:SAM-dependent methyltransferase